MMMDFRPLFFPAAGRARACRASQKPQAHREPPARFGECKTPLLRNFYAADSPVQEGRRRK